MSEIIELRSSRGPYELMLELEELGEGEYRVVRKGVVQKRSAILSPHRLFDLDRLRVGQIVRRASPDEVLGELV